MECSFAISRMFQYDIGDMGIEEDMEEAAETADGVFRPGGGGCGEGCKCGHDGDEDECVAKL